MSNRRRPRNQAATAGPLTIAPELPLPLQRVDWSDSPAAPYPQPVLEWMAQRVGEIGRMNVWQCEECNAGVLCYDLHPGVTPFTVSHHALGEPECPGICRSHFYNGDDAREWKAALGEPSHEWYRPSVTELSRESKFVKEHVMQGGLLVREVAA